MTEAHTFQRARKPAERSLRREAILRAAAELFDAEGARGAGLNAIAAHAGFTKSNVYRYFESREEVLLSLLLESFEAFTSEFEVAAQSGPPGDPASLARLAAAGFSRRPRLGKLLGILATVLEQNVSEATVIDLKRSIAGYLSRIATAISRQLPGTTIEDCVWAAGMVGTIVSGMWPSAHPSPVVERVMTSREFAHLKPSLERDLERATLALLQSIIPRP